VNDTTTIQLRQTAGLVHNYVKREIRILNAARLAQQPYPVVSDYLDGWLKFIVREIVFAVDYNASMSELHNLH